MFKLNAPLSLLPTYRLIYTIIVSMMLLSLPVFAERDCSEVSIDCGKTPSVIFDDTDRLWAIFVQGSHVYVTYSDDAGRAFSTPTKVNAVAETIDSNGENRPKIAVGLNGEIFLSWTQKTETRFTGNIRFSRSLDAGKTFETPKTINDDGLDVGHRFDQLYVSPKGLLYLAWLDKRDKAAATAKGKKYRGSAVYYAVSTDAGKNFGKNHKIADNSCECCRLTMAEASGEKVALLWRHIFNTNTRDHAIATLTPNGTIEGLSRSTADEWKIDACPHHGPDLAYAGDGTYHQAWFSLGDNHKGLFYGRYSSKNGTHRVRAIDTSPGASHPQIAVLGNQLVYVWKLFDGKQASVQMVRSTDGGITWSQASTVASTQSGSDHPLLTTSTQALYLSWSTEQSYRFERLKI
ncbi:MAG: hypothetical protein ACI89U_002568 [Gammaproteobacteria bacterium]|jgi:hypothetical protein